MASESIKDRAVGMVLGRDIKREYLRPRIHPNSTPSNSLPGFSDVLHCYGGSGGSGGHRRNLRIF